MSTPIEFIIHHSGGTDTQPLADSSNYTFAQCNADHKVRFNFISSLGFYVGYQYVIEKDGKTTQGRADTEEGAHTVGRNKDSIGIMLSGNFDATLPTQAQITALKELFKKLAPKYNIKKASPHRAYAKKTCYGNKLSDTWAQEILNSVLIKTPTREEAIAEIKRLSQFI